MPYGWKEIKAQRKRVNAERIAHLEQDFQRQVEKKALDKKNAYGFNDPTPYEAMKRISEQEQRTTHSA